MSAPSTNVDKQSKRHRPVIWGFIAVAIFVAVLFFAYLANLSAQGNEPGEETEAPAAAATTDG
ncbi:hypothetical protein [uncultured Marivita sp.]|uniref:hypothetical protein n=1 Tax=uncultured Marivita sp. TaxID=888080 RepID=UPI00262B6687|nr:hypothetical protein [uncultured Marivita sp.]